MVVQVFRLFLFLVCWACLWTPSPGSCPCGYGSYCGFAGLSSGACHCELSQDLYQQPTEPNVTCSTLVDHCAPSPCQNGATCTNGFGSYLCLCLNTHHGRTCDKTKDPSTRTFAERVLVFYDIHEQAIEGKITFYIALKWLGEQFSLKVDDGAGYVADYDSIKFQLGSPMEVCEGHIHRIPDGDPNICNLLPNNQFYMGAVTLRFPVNLQAPKIIKDGNTVLGRLDKVTVMVKNGDEVAFENQYNVFTFFSHDALLCSLDIDMKQCSLSSSKPVVYGKDSIIFLRGTTKPILSWCKYVTKVDYRWDVSGPSGSYSYQGDPVHRIDARNWDIGNYMIEYNVGLFGSASPGVHKQYFWTFKRCWLKLGWTDPVPLLAGGQEVVLSSVGQHTLDASQSSDPNSADNSRLRYTWYCTTEDSFCNPVTTTRPSHVVRGLQVGRSYEFFLNLTTVGSDRPPVVTSQKVTIVKEKVLPGFKLLCKKNCLMVNPREIVHFEVVGRPKAENVSWSYSTDGGGAVDAAALRQGLTEEDTFIIKPSALQEGHVYNIKATVGSTYNSWQLKTFTKPKQGACTISPASGSHYTFFTVTCSGFEATDSSAEPLTYDVYEKIEGNVLQFLLASSTSQTISNLQLSSGQLTVKVIDNFGANVETKLSATVSPPAASVDEVEKLIYKLQDNIRAVDSSRSLSTVNVVAKVVGSMENKSTIIDRVLKRISNVPIYEISDVKQVASGVENLLVKGTEGERDILKSSSVMNAASVLKTVCSAIESSSHSKTPPPREDILTVTKSVLTTFGPLLASRDKLLTDTAVDPEAYEEALEGYRLGTEDILFCINSLGNAVLNTLVKSQEEIKITTKSADFWVKTDTVKNFVEMDKLEAAENGGAYISLSESFGSSYKGQTLDLQLVELKENPVWWERTGRTKNSTISHLDINMRLRSWSGSASKIIHLRKPLHIHFKVENVTDVEDSLGLVELPPEEATVKEKDLHVAVHRIDRPTGGSGRIFLKFNHLESKELLVVLLVGERPDMKLVQQRGRLVSSSQPWFQSDVFSNQPPQALYYIGVLPSSKHKPGEKLHYAFEIHDSLCRIWVNSMWNFQACTLGVNTSLEEIHCLCSHLSLFGASFLVPPNRLDPISDIEVWLSIKDNPYVVIVVCVFLIIFTGLFFWTRKMDKRDLTEGSLIFLEDNLPGDAYAYLLVVHTGNKASSGTTASVGVQITGEDAMSRAHVITYEGKRLQMSSDDWFLIYTPEYLGKIEEVHVWHDNSGISPDWYCKQIEIYDLENGAHYMLWVDDWLSIRQADKNWKLEWHLKPTVLQKFENFQTLSKENIFMFLRERHAWMSIFMKHPRSPLTRTQRLVVTMVIVMTTMLAGIMFYGRAGEIVEDDYAFSLKTREIIIMIETIIITWPLASIAAYLFKLSKTAEQPETLGWKDYIITFVKDFFLKFILLDPLLPVQFTGLLKPEENKDKSKVKRMFLILAWAFSLFLIFGSGIFIMYYGLKFGPNKSLIWLSVVLLRIIKGIVIIQPLKVIIFALILSCLKGKRETNLYEVNPKELNDRGLEDDPEYMNTVLELRSQTAYRPLTEIEVMGLFKSRKKKDKQMWNMVGLFFATITFLILFFLITFAGDHKLDLHTRHVINMLTLPMINEKIEIGEVYNKSSYKKYLTGTLLPSFHFTEWYNGKLLPTEVEEDADHVNGTTNHRGWMIDFSTKMMGVPRMRQLRMKPDTCSVTKPFRPHFFKCNASYSIRLQDTDSYAPGWTQIEDDHLEIRDKWFYETDILSESVGIFGRSGIFYPGGGYTQNLSRSFTASEKALMKLEVEGWLDSLTRMSVFELMLYNVNSNIFSAVSILTEHLASGVYVSRVRVTSAYYDFFIKTDHTGYFVCFVFLVIVLGLSSLRIILHMTQTGILGYFSSWWRVHEVIIAIVGFASVTVFLVRAAYFRVYCNLFEQTDVNSFVSFFYPFYCEEVLSVFLSLLIFFVSLRLVILVKYGTAYQILQTALWKARPFIIGVLLLVLFLLILVSYLGYIWGAQYFELFPTLQVPKIKFIHYQNEILLSSSEKYFSLVVNLLYFFCAIFITAIVIYRYALAKYSIVAYEGVVQYPNRFLEIYHAFQSNMRAIMNEPPELRLRGGGNGIRNLRSREGLRSVFMQERFVRRKYQFHNLISDMDRVIQRNQDLNKKLDLLIRIYEKYNK